MTSMWYDVGSKHDPDGRSGFAHLFEHILSRKTVNMPYNAINKMVDDVGGTRNASTWYDRTNYYETVPAEYLERMLWTHASAWPCRSSTKRCSRPSATLSRKSFGSGFSRRPMDGCSTSRSAKMSTTSCRIGVQRSAALRTWTSATLEDARAFHEAYYGPDTATLIVAGNFDPAKLNALVDKYFGLIPSRPHKISLAITTKDKPITARVVTATGPNVPLPVAGRAYQLPGEAHPDMAALEG